jgi:hypothetical protein
MTTHTALSIEKWAFVGPWVEDKKSNGNDDEDG